MARKRLSREESQVQTRARLLQAARAVFARRGYGGASVDEIAAEAGYSKGAVYSNFTSKEDLFLELDRIYTGEEIAKMDAQLNRLGAAKASPGEVVKAIESWLTAFMAEREWFVLGAELHLYAQRNDAFAAKCATFKNAHRKRLAMLIARVFELHGKEPPANVDHIAAMMIGMSVGLALIQNRHSEGPQPAALMMETMNQFLATARKKSR
jgi:AcrR family transcriptional regulator